MRTARIPPRCSPSGCRACRAAARSTSRAAPGATHYSSRREAFASARSTFPPLRSSAAGARPPSAGSTSSGCAPISTRRSSKRCRAGGFDLIVWVRYVHPKLMPHLIARLDDGGTLLCEQHLATTAQVAGPTSAAFRLAPGNAPRDGAKLAGTPLIRGPAGGSRWTRRGSGAIGRREEALIWVTRHTKFSPSRLGCRAMRGISLFLGVGTAAAWLSASFVATAQQPAPAPHRPA